MAKETQLHITEEMKERVILVGVDQDTIGMDTESCLDELEELVKTAGAESVARIIQKREKVHPAHYLGKGKIED